MKQRRLAGQPGQAGRTPRGHAAPGWIGQPRLRDGLSFQGMVEPAVHAGRRQQERQPPGVGKRRHVGGAEHPASAVPRRPRVDVAVSDVDDRQLSRVDRRPDQGAHVRVGIEPTGVEPHRPPPRRQRRERFDEAVGNPFDRRRRAVRDGEDARGKLGRRGRPARRMRSKGCARRGRRGGSIALEVDELGHHRAHLGRRRPGEAPQAHVGQAVAVEVGERGVARRHAAVG